MNTMPYAKLEAAAAVAANRRTRATITAQSCFPLFSFYFLGVIGLDIYYTIVATIPFVLSLLVLVGGFATGLLFLQLASTTTGGRHEDHEAPIGNRQPRSNDVGVPAAHLIGAVPHFRHPTRVAC